MSWVTSVRKFGVILLTLRRPLTPALAVTLAAGLSGCSYIHRHYVEPCKTRAYITMSVPDYINKRFAKHSPVRLAIVPYSVPANLSFKSSEHQGLGTELAWRVHQEILPTQIVPISEVFNRTDWPGKKDEFYTGNYGALSLARDAGYDLVMVGDVQPTTSLDTMTARTKIIEVESGITVYYGEATVVTNLHDIEKTASTFWLWPTENKPSAQYISSLNDDIGRCIVHGIKEIDQYKKPGLAITRVF